MTEPEDEEVMDLIVDGMKDEYCLTDSSEPVYLRDGLIGQGHPCLNTLNRSNLISNKRNVRQIKNAIETFEGEISEAKNNSRVSEENKAQLILFCRDNISFIDKFPHLFSGNHIAAKEKYKNDIIEYQHRLLRINNFYK